jgi:hypothetical protein
MDEEFQRKLAGQIGRRLRTARERRVLTPSDPERLCGIAARRLKRCEAVACQVTVTELETLAAALALPMRHCIEGCAVCGTA